MFFGVFSETCAYCVLFLIKNRKDVKFANCFYGIKLYHIFNETCVFVFCKKNAVSPLF